MRCGGHLPLGLNKRAKVVQQKGAQIHVGGHRVYAAQEIGYGNWHCAFRKLYGTYSPVHHKDPKEKADIICNLSVYRSRLGPASLGTSAPPFQPTNVGFF